MAKIRLSVESEDATSDLVTTPEQIEEANDISLADNIDELSCKIDTGLESIAELLETKALLMDIANRKNDNRLISAMETRVLGTLKEVGENVGISTEKLALETSMIHAAASKIGSLITWIKDGLIAIWKAIVKACSRIYQFVANFFKSSEKKEDDISDIIDFLNKNKAEMEKSREQHNEFVSILKEDEERMRRQTANLKDKLNKMSGGESRRSRPFSGLYEKSVQVNQPTDGHGHIKPTKYDKTLDTDIVDVENKNKGLPGYSREDFSNAVFASAPTNSYMYLGKRGEQRFLDANEAKLDQLLSFAQEKLCVSTSHNYRNLIGKIYDLFHDLHFGNDLIPTDLKHFLANSDSYDSKLSAYREKISGKLEDIHTMQGKLINDVVGKEFIDSNIKVSRVTNSRYFNSFEFTFTGFDEKDLHNIDTLDPHTFKSLLDTINKNINIFKFTSSDKVVELLYDKSLNITQKIEETITKFSRSVDEKSLEGGSIDASVHRLSKYAHSLNEILTEAVKKLNTLINEIFKQHKATSALLLGIVKAFRATVDYSLDTIKSISYKHKADDGNPLYK
jgi:predicted nuclease with TOPRIM domain